MQTNWMAANIQQLRKATGMTQKQFAEWLGVTVIQVQHLENKRRNPSGPVMRLLNILTERLRSGEFKKVQSKRKRGKS
jgi:DNA-binding transcriptional regulator YiaG